MIKFIIMLLLMVAGTSAFAGECVSSNCVLLRSRVVNVTREVINVPATVTRRTVEATRNVGRKTVNRVRSIVR